MPFTTEEQQRYARHFVLQEIGPGGQEKLRSSKVLVIGAGALGGTALLYLAAAGVGTLGVAEFDRVELSNLQRQTLYTVSDVGRDKLDAAVAAIRARNPHVTVVPHRGRVTPETLPALLKPYDFVLDCTDRFETKFLINDACVLGRKPYCHAGVLRFEGQVLTYLPGKGPCLRCLLGNVPTGAPTCAESGVLGAVTGVVGSLQALEAIKYLLGVGDLLVGRVFRFDGLTMEARVSPFPHRDPECPVCGEHPTVRDLTSPGVREQYEPAGCETEVPAREMDFRTFLQTRTESDLLLDAREEGLRKFGGIPGSLPYPADDGGLPTDRRIFVYCQTGEKSASLVRRLNARGLDAYNLTGGFRAYLRLDDGTS